MLDFRGNHYLLLYRASSILKQPARLTCEDSPGHGRKGITITHCNATRNAPILPALILTIRDSVWRALALIRNPDGSPGRALLFDIRGFQPLEPLTRESSLDPGQFGSPTPGLPNCSKQPVQDDHP